MTNKIVPRGHVRGRAGRPARLSVSRSTPLGRTYDWGDDPEPVRLGWRYVVFVALYVGGWVVLALIGGR